MVRPRPATVGRTRRTSRGGSGPSGRAARQRCLAAETVAALGLILSLTGCGGGTPPASAGTSKPLPVIPSIAPTGSAPTGSNPAEISGGAGSSQVPACTPAQVRLTVKAARATYSSGDPVIVRISIRNRGRTPCGIPRSTCLPQVVITDHSGGRIWNRATSKVLCVFAATRRLTPGKATVRSITWDGRRCAGRDPVDCPGTPASRGTYRITATWGAATAATTFRIA